MIFRTYYVKGKRRMPNSQKKGLKKLVWSNYSIGNRETATHHHRNTDSSMETPYGPIILRFV
jgi:hypothetical protein